MPRVARWKPREHGSETGYGQHFTYCDGPPCGPCLRAHSEYVMTHQRRTKPCPECELVEVGRRAKRCPACWARMREEARLERARLARARREARIPKCGSDSAYYRHRRLGEVTCEPCLKAHADAWMIRQGKEPLPRKPRKQPKPKADLEWQLVGGVWRAEKMVC